MRLRQYPTAGQFAGIVLLLLVLWRATHTPPEPADLPAEGLEVRVIRAVDGDTLLVEGDYRIRLFGVDTPETKHPDRPEEPWGTEAYEYTKQRVEGKVVRLEFDRERQDPYGRWLAYVWIGDSMLNEELISEGYTEAETRFPFRGDRQRQFVKAEESAREAGRGIWSTSPPPMRSE
ncbi:MAG: thermonuclease family protein [Planctomycetaceae bacterium]|nr:thermonuclease family protein [Planctomycetaceae bacterium]MCB9949700.1 thermonuclease family protein [Planctomycetaceae bacterium]